MAGKFAMLVKNEEHTATQPSDTQEYARKWSERENLKVTISIN
jgi:hypothetical protein